MSLKVFVVIISWGSTKSRFLRPNIYQSNKSIFIDVTRILLLARTAELLLVKVCVFIYMLALVDIYLLLVFVSRVYHDYIIVWQQFMHFFAKLLHQIAGIFQ